MNGSFSRFCPRTVLCAVIAMAFAASHARAEETPADLERQVKAAFLYKFSGYVEWPSHVMPKDKAPIVFGIMGDDDLADELTSIVERRGEAARPVRVLRVKAFEPLPEGLHILFIGHSESDHLGPLIRIARARPVLIVTDTEGALALGSMINFALVEGRVRFDVGLLAAQHSGLTLSARLLAVAQTVEKREP